MPNGNKVCVHAFLDPNKVYQTTPWNMRTWHCGGTGSISANNTHIGFEICEPKNYTDKEYFLSIKQTALELCKYLVKEYNIPIDKVTSHCEGYKKYGTAFASNHSDLDHWWKKYHNYTMDNFRAELVEMLKEETMADIPELSVNDKCEKIKQVAVLEDGTIKWFCDYKWNVPLIDKLYQMAVDAEKWREHLKNAEK